MSNPNLRLRPKLSDDKADALELVMGTLVDLQLSAKSMADYGAAIAELATGLSPSGVLHSETRMLNVSAGTLTIDSRVPAASIAVANLGTSVLTVSNGGQGSTTPPGPSAGTIKLLPGQVICVPLRGSAHSFWGRPGELFTFTSYKTLQPFAMSNIGGSYHAVNLGTLTVGTPATIYTTPQGDNAYYGGLAVADTSGPAGTPDVTELKVADSNGLELDTIHLGGGETAADSYTNPTVATSSRLVVTLTKGAIEGLIRVW